MYLKEGKSGFQEGTAILALSLCISGLFSFDSGAAYSYGNSTYVSLPFACFIAFAVFGLVAFAMKRCGTSSLYDFTTATLGKPIGGTVCVLWLLFLVVCTSSLLDRFIYVMQSYFFQASDTFHIAVYMFIVMFAFSLMGFESITRTGKIIALFLLVMQVIILINSSSGYHIWNLYPLMGDGMIHSTKYAYQSILCFIPACVSALIMSDGMHGIDFTSKNMKKAVVISAIIICITQILLGMSFTYHDLSGLYMPLYRMSMVTGKENFIIRFDKLSAFVWLMGAMLTSAFYMYSASNLYSKVFSVKDIRPCALSLSTVCILLCVLSHFADIPVYDFFAFFEKYGTLFFVLPLVITCAISFMKGTRHV